MAANKAYDWIAIEENALIDFQFALIDAMGAAGLTKADIARILGVSRARVSQMLDSEANPTLKVVARAMAAVGGRVSFENLPTNLEKKGRKSTIEDSFVESLVVARAADSGWDVQQRKRRHANENRYWPFVGKVAA